MHLYCDALSYSSKYLFKPRQRRLIYNLLFKPRQRRLAVRMITDFVSFICNLKAVL
ncbi:hypothetical protein [Streptococcus pneumoniae]|uniref:hypothetical protein n=1 Tax=Streptococcus pneumoniae TaxID=1313 RepID=UPI0015DB26B7|nr:hypothetical protein [Streptococcus pneumoniae]